MLRALCVLLMLSFVTAAAPAAPTVAAEPDTQPDTQPHTEAGRGPASVLLKGRGFGHGRGMSQYGAQERAKDGHGYKQILRFYYSGLDLGDATGSIKVLISSDTGDDVVVRQARGLKVRQVSTGTSWRLGSVAPRATRWKLTAARGNAATRVSYLTARWHSWKVVPGEAEFLGGTRPLTLIDPAGTRRYQGTLRSVTALPDDDRDTVNVVSLENYLRGVVPREMPAQWDPDAVRAQAVAARTYADHARDNPRPYYDICSSTSCQVYGGVGDAEPESDAAIRATAGEVLQSGGASALTEFSSSNGGWTVAGSVPYLVAKRDTWDPVNGWRYRLPATKIEDAYPKIGDFRRLRVLKRDGHGTWNGRVIRLRIVGRSGSVTRRGESFREKLSLRSTWWRQS